MLANNFRPRCIFNFITNSSAYIQNDIEGHLFKNNFVREVGTDVGTNVGFLVGCGADYSVDQDSSEIPTS